MFLGGECVVGLYSFVVSQMFFRNQGMAVERKGSEMVLLTCLLKMGSVPGFCI